MLKAHLIYEEIICSKDIFKVKKAAFDAINENACHEFYSYIIPIVFYDEVKEHLLSLKEEYKELTDTSEELYQIDCYAENPHKPIKQYKEYFKIKIDIFEIYTIYFVRDIDSEYIKKYYN